MMGNLPGKEPSELLQRQSRVKAAPLDTREQQATSIMGRWYRTPSPAPESRFAPVEDEISPKQKSNIATPFIVETRSSSSQDNISAPSTPSIQQRPPSHVFGLLTPSTPDFGSFNRKSPAFGVNGYNDCDNIIVIPKPLKDGVAAKALCGANTTVHDLRKESQELRTAAHGPRQQNSNHDFDEDDVSDTEEPLETQFDKMQQEIRDAQAAAQLTEDQETFGKRRSTRLAKRPIALDTQLTVAPSKPWKKSSVVQACSANSTSPPLSSLSADALVHLPPDPNPALLSLSWELQYPPGGSTHPSYRYPELDPRLFFDPALVPVVDSLPSVFAVPPLVLPMGWRHVSWSGFLPIVFDPNHQAFKLTPIGPLPLTCEEVQQGGLAKHVPGGECHPEAGLLPDMTAWSDGSDEKYNFYGVDWVLPFAKGETFDGTPLADDMSPDRPRCSTAMGELHRVIVSAPPSPLSLYLESRDCPDDIVDIEDAWRWLTDKEINPTTPFVPSPNKTWRGTGIRRTTRRCKAPIASLMVSAISEKFASPNDALAAYLINQNGREFCAFHSVATPVHVNITLLKDVEITLIELLSYFPNHYLWRKAADRIVRSGMTAADLTNVINYVRILEGDSARRNGSINEKLSWEYEGPGSRKRLKIVRDDRENATYTTEGWTYATWELTDYPLFGLTHGLKHVPEGLDAGPLTAIIKWCREQGRYDTLLSDVPELIQSAGIKGLIEAGEGGDPDKEVMGRHMDVLKKDRKRVLKVAGARKRATEKEECVKRKKVKSE